MFVNISSQIARTGMKYKKYKYNGGPCYQERLLMVVKGPIEHIGVQCGL